jgi:hypothetical protein
MEKLVIVGAALTSTLESRMSGKYVHDDNMRTL